MKKLFVISLLTIAVWSCSHKTTPSQATATTSPAIDAGKSIYIAKCQRCHGLKDPADYTANQWVPILDNMAKKAALTDDEKANVLAYVDANARK
jgi:hypothetical protein